METITPYPTVTPEKVGLRERLIPYTRYLLPLGLFLFAIFIYISAMDNELLISWDDNRYINENQLLRDFPSSLDNIFTEDYFAAYIPMTILSYALEYTVWELNPTGYHLTNIILHAINGILVFYFVSQLQERRSVALIAALLFIAHPVQTENVAWVAQRKSLLSLLFYLLAWLAHINAKKPAPNAKKMPLAWFLFLLAILAKPTAVGGGLLFILYDFFWTKEKLLKSISLNLPYLIIGVAGSILIVVAHEEVDGIKGGVFDNFDRRMGVLLWATGDYALSLVNPFSLNNMYIYFVSEVTPTNPHIWFGVAVLIALGLFAFFQPLGKPYSLFTVVWVILMMLPVSNIIPIAIQRADRYMYYPSIVVFMMVGIAFMRLWDWAKTQEARYVLSAIGGGVMAICIVLTGERNNVWLNEDTLWADHLEEYPTSETGLLNRGVHFFRHQDYDTASELFTELLAHFPYHYKGNRFMGFISQFNEDDANAAFYFGRAVAVNPNDNDVEDELGSALIDLGVVAIDQGDYARALEMYQQAALYIPQEPVLYNNIGFTLFKLSQFQDAITAYDTALALNPSYARALVNKGSAALALLDYETSYRSYEQAVAQNTQLDADSFSNYCLAGGEIRADPQIVLPICERAVQLNPTNAFYWGRTAHVLLLYDQAESALAAAQQTIALDPNSVLGHRTLGDASARLGDVETARAAYTRTLELDANNRAAQAGLANLGG